MFRILSTERTDITICVVLQVDGREAEVHQDNNIRVFRPPTGQGAHGQPGSSATVGGGRAALSSGTHTDDLEEFFRQQRPGAEAFKKASQKFG
jgi:hypothetical protein